MPRIMDGFERARVTRIARMRLHEFSGALLSLPDRDPELTIGEVYRELSVKGEFSSIVREFFFSIGIPLNWDGQETEATISRYLLGRRAHAPAVNACVPLSIAPTKGLYYFEADRSKRGRVCFDNPYQGKLVLTPAQWDCCCMFARRGGEVVLHEEIHIPKCLIPLINRRIQSVLPDFKLIISIHKVGYRINAEQYIGGPSALRRFMDNLQDR